MAARKRRHRHPGVTLMKPSASARTGWRARWADPEAPEGTTRYLYETLPRELVTAEQRTAWAIAKSRALGGRRTEIANGAIRATGTALNEAVKTYFEAHKRLRENTISTYRSAADRLLAWAAQQRIRSTDDLTRANLLGFRAWVASEKKRVPVEGGARGEHEESDEPRSAAAVNRDLRSVRAILGYIGELDLLPKMKDADLRRALKRYEETREEIEYLKPRECQVLLEAALRHDAERWTVTREEAAGLRPVGTTACFDRIAPLVAGVLLSGMRIEEALTLEWSQVDLDALDSLGRAAGEIRLKGSGTKTKKARVIDLSVSPALHTLLSAMKLRSGGQGSVFGVTRGVAVAAAKRLRNEYGAPSQMTWQVLRRSTGTYLTNAPGIYGAASVYHSARQLGHSTKVAEAYYLGRERGIPRDANSLEDAMQIAEVMQRVIANVGAAPAKPRLVAVAGR